MILFKICIFLVIFLSHKLNFTLLYQLVPTAVAVKGVCKYSYRCENYFWPFFFFLFFFSSTPTYCYGADKRVDPANDLSLSVPVMTAKDNEGNKGEVTNITKMTIYCRVYKRVCKVRGSSICVFS